MYGFGLKENSMKGSGTIRRCSFVGVALVLLGLILCSRYHPASESTFFCIWIKQDVRTLNSITLSACLLPSYREDNGLKL